MAWMHSACQTRVAPGAKIDFGFNRLLLSQPVTASNCPNETVQWFKSPAGMVENNQYGQPLMPLILEAVVTTLAADGTVHVTPLGYQRRNGMVLLAPFEPSLTLQNLRRVPHAVLNFTDDVRVIAGCLTGRRHWPTVAASGPVPRLAAALAYEELSVRQIEDDVQRPRFWCGVTAAATVAPFVGFNRAQWAVVEAAVLVSRLDWLPPEEVSAAFVFLRSAVKKTAGPREQEAWQWLLDAVANHPRHGGAGS